MVLCIVVHFLWNSLLCIRMPWYLLLYISLYSPLLTPWLCPWWRQACFAVIGWYTERWVALLLTDLCMYNGLYIFEILLIDFDFTCILKYLDLIMLLRCMRWLPLRFPSLWIIVVTSAEYLFDVMNWDLEINIVCYAYLLNVKGLKWLIRWDAGSRAPQWVLVGTKRCPESVRTSWTSTGVGSRYGC